MSSASERGLGCWMAAAGLCLVLLVYLLSAPRSITFEDAPELALASHTLGVAHPPGYPTYLLASKLFGHLFPWLEPGRRTNLFSTVSAVAGLAVLYLLLKGLSKDRMLASAAALLTAFSRTFWNTSVITEVYALNFLFWVLLVWLAFRYTEPDGPIEDGVTVRKENIPTAAGFLLGFAAGNHQMILLGVPAGLALLRKGGPRLTFGTVLSMLLGFLLGAAVYVYLPIRAADGPFLNWGDPSNVDAFLKVVLREQYGDVGQGRVDWLRVLRQSLSINPVYEWFGAPDFEDHLRHFRWSLLIPWSAVLILAAWGWVSDPHRHARRFFLASFILFGPFLVWLTRTPAQKEFTLKVFFLPLWPILGYYFLRGVREAASRLAGKPLPAWPLLLFGLVALVVNWRVNRMDDYPYAVDYRDNLLRSAPYGGVLLTVKDNETFPLWYGQGVLGLRPDAAVVNHVSLSEGWYRRSLRRTYRSLADLPEPRTKTRERSRSETFGWFFTSPPGPLVAANRDLPLPQEWTYRPWGAAYRILRDGERSGSFPADHALAFRGLDRTVAERPYDVMTLLMVQTYARLAQDAGDVASDEGRLEEAWRHYERSVRFNRILGFEVNNFHNYVRMGRILMERGRVEEGRELWRKAVALQPRSEAAASLLQALAVMEGRVGTGPSFAARAEQAYRQGRYAEAARLYEEALRRKEIPPARAYANIGDCHFQTGRYDAAEGWYRRAIATDPDYITPYYNLGGVLWVSGRREEAVRVWREGLRRAPDHPLLTKALNTYGAGR